MPWVSPDESLDVDEPNRPSNNCDDPDPNHANPTRPFSPNCTKDLGRWLKGVGHVFRKLSPEDKNRCLDHLIGLCDGAQLYHLSKSMNLLPRIDFLSELPHDLVLHLASFFGADTMRTCCLVSKSWNAAINSCNSAWRIAAVSQGVNLESLTACQPGDHKALYLKATHCRAQLRAGKALDQSVMYGHRDRIMTVYYHNNIIATGSDDHTVRLWSCVTGVCLRILHTHNTVATVRFDDYRILTASFNTKATLWDFATGKELQIYVGHVAAIFSLDYDFQLDVLVTGSADSTVKVWVMSSGEMLQTLTQHRSAWITQVCLYWDRSQDSYTILSRDDALIYMWRMTRGHKITSSRQITNSEGSTLLPGWQVNGPLVTYTVFVSPATYRVTQLDLRDKEVKPVVREFALQSGPQDNPFPMSSFRYFTDPVPQGFLGCGRHFTVILCAIDGEQSEVQIIQNSTGRQVASVEMPPDYRPSKRGSTFTLGDRTWLDGFGGDATSGVFLVSCLRDNGIVQLTWKPALSESDTASGFSCEQSGFMCEETEFNFEDIEQ